MIDRLEFIIALAREGHFGRAAETCRVSQPTLSGGIKYLEDMFGVLLVQRGSRFHGFTPEGERVLEWARRIVGDARAMRQDIDALKRGLVGHVKIAAIPTALAMTAMLTTPYRAKHPNVRFSIVSKTSIDVLRLLDDLEVDAGLTYLDNEPVGRVNTVPLYYEEYRLLTSPAAALGDRDSVTWAEVGQVPLCLLTPDMQNRRIIDALLRSAGQEPSPDPRIEFDDRLVRACAYRQMGEHHAGETRRNAWPDRQRPLHPDRRAGGDARGRAYCPTSRADDTAARGGRHRGPRAGEGLGPDRGGGEKPKRKQSPSQKAGTP